MVIDPSFPPSHKTSDLSELAVKEEGAVIGTIHEELSPASSLTLIVTFIVAPAGIIVPASGLWLITREAAELQLSEATTSLSRFATCATQFAPVAILRAAGQVRIIGGVVSTTFTVRVSIRSLFEASLTL